MDPVFLAIDFGAESGRVMAVRLTDDAVDLTEIHRFGHRPIQLPSGLHWDISGLWREVVDGLTAAGRWARDHSCQLVSVGVDAWGVDWGLIGASGELVGLPHAYRDARYLELYSSALQIASAEEIYQITGIQLMPINSLFSLYAQTQTGPELLPVADRLLFIPDIIHYWLSGVAAVEETIASTSQLIDHRTGSWSDELIGRFGLPPKIFGELSLPGTVLGPIRADLADTCGLPRELQVVLPAAHDTASAVAAVPATNERAWCFLSSGTWSLLGAELPSPCVTPAAQAANFTNERGVNQTTRFLKNIAGLWLVQQVRQDLERQGHSLSYAQLTAAAEQAPAFRAVFDVDRPELQQPGEILEKLTSLFVATGQPVPNQPGEFVRSCLESLALTYRRTFHRLEQLLDRRIEVIHVVGGGGQNSLLNQMTADALNRTVVVGPYEATALGNGLVQAMATDRVQDLDQLRQRVARSVSLQTFSPQAPQAWDQAAARLGLD